MKEFTIKAYGDEYGLPNKTKIIEAKDKNEAYQLALEIFSEYEDIGVWENVK